MFRTNITCFVQAKVVHRRNKILSVNKTSSNVKKPTEKSEMGLCENKNKICITDSRLVSSVFISLNFKTKLLIAIKDDKGSLNCDNYSTKSLYF